jgi:nucleotide-binding universal stress UspA family protein
MSTLEGSITYLSPVKVINRKGIRAIKDICLGIYHKKTQTLMEFFMEKKQIKKILCAVDFAEYSKELVAYAKTLQDAFNCEIHVIYVAPTLSQYVGFQISPSSIENFVGEIITGAEETMEKFIKENFPENSKVIGKVLTGYAAEEIINYCEENHIDLIVMGTHGRKGIDRILFGSVAEKVVKSSYIPVLTIRPKK